MFFIKIDSPEMGVGNGCGEEGEGEAVTAAKIAIVKWLCDVWRANPVHSTRLSDSDRR